MKRRRESAATRWSVRVAAATAAVAVAALAWWIGAGWLAASRDHADAAVGLTRGGPSGWVAPETRVLRWPSEPFDARRFASPALAERPYLRWSPWPDAAPVDAVALLDALAAAGFGGVQLPIEDPRWNAPTACAAARQGPDGERRAASSHWDAVLARAETLGLGVHWIAGAPLAAPTAKVSEDGPGVLVAAEMTVVGRETTQTVSLPIPRAHWSQRVAAALSLAWPPTRAGGFRAEPRQLLGVTAARVVAERGGAWPWADSRQTVLDAETVMDLSADADPDDETLTRAFGDGEWRLLALWRVPSGERTGRGGAAPGLAVVGLLDHAVANALHKCLFDAGADARARYRGPIAAIGVDGGPSRSAQPPVSADFVAAFRARRGYDPRPWLFTALGDSPAAPRGSARYALTDGALGDRFRYDYWLTVSDLYTERFVATGRRWAAWRGTVHRIAPHDIAADRIRAAGAAGVPEAVPRGADALDIQLTAAGAHFHERPWVGGAVLASHPHRHDVTPDDVKRAADRLFAHGANHIVLRQLPAPTAHWPFWREQAELNRYLARMQYLMRRGPRRIDALLHYPWLDVPGAADAPYGKERARRWLAAQAPLIAQLEANGIRWTWVNDHSLRHAQAVAEANAGPAGDHDDQATDGAGGGAPAARPSIMIGQRRYAGLLISDVPFIGYVAARRVQQLHRGGADVLLLGAAPTRQAGLRRHRGSDREVSRMMDAIAAASTGRSLRQWIAGIQARQALAFAAPAPGLARVTRTGPGQEALSWFRNGGDAAVQLDLRPKDPADWHGRRQFWLDAERGELDAARWPLRRWMPPGSQIALLSLPLDAVPTIPPGPERARPTAPTESLALERWRLVDADGRQLLGPGPLSDLSAQRLSRHLRGVVYYASDVSLDDADGWTLHAGALRGTAQVHVNQRRCGRLALAPWTLPLDGCLAVGANRLEIGVRLTDHNHYIGLARRGDPNWAPMRGQALLPSGLLGPVSLQR